MTSLPVFLLSPLESCGYMFGIFVLRGGTPGSAQALLLAQASVLVGFGGPSGRREIEPKLTACKAST